MWNHLRNHWQNVIHTATWLKMQPTQRHVTVLNQDHDAISSETTPAVPSSLLHRHVKCNVTQQLEILGFLSYRKDKSRPLFLQVQQHRQGLTVKGTGHFINTSRMSIVVTINDEKLCKDYWASCLKTHTHSLSTLIFDEILTPGYSNTYHLPGITPHDRLPFQGPCCGCRWGWPQPKDLTQVVIPLDEKRAILSSKSMPPTPITSIWSAGLLRVLEQARR